MSQLKVNRLSTREVNFASRLEELSAVDLHKPADLVQQVSAIIARIEQQGDSALLEYAARFDGLNLADADQLKLTPKDFQMALERIEAKDRQALEMAADRITRYHAHQRVDSWEYQDELGNLLGQRISPIERVGFCIPGGRASYPSSLLMSVLPAKIAGVKEVVMVSPQGTGHPYDMVLAAAALAGVDYGYCSGGAHTVAALACGTESIARVDKIVGPGGLYVTEAKRQLFGRVGIDMIAGPSEVMVISDASAPPSMLAFDLLAQAEHDSASQALLVSPDKDHLDEVEQAIREALDDLPRRELIEASLSNRGGLIVCDSLSEAADLANRLAPEHLELAVQQPDQLLPLIRNAGAIFLGARTPEVLGDYNAGPSHVLPTFGSARFSSPLGVYDFIKRSSVIAISQEGLNHLVAPAARLARQEGLEAHARSAEARLVDLASYQPTGLNKA